ncbi:MAG TPA: BatD family protein [Victivallales bacterium]|nr:BatD family protein [Victivallales bacterium]
MNCKLFILFTAIFFSTQAVYGEIQISLQPTPVVAGEPASLSIRSTNGKAEITQLPEIPNLKWIQPDLYGSSIMIINGVRYETTTYNFVVSKTGLIELPALTIKINDEKYNTKPKPLRVISGPLTDLEEYIFLKPKYVIGNKNKIYIGEELPLEIYIYRAESLSAAPVEYPQIKLNGIIFEDFSKLNRDSERFARYPYLPPTKVSIDGISYIKTCFYTSYRPIITGRLDGTVSLLLDITLPNRNKRNPYKNSFFDDDIFNSVFNSDSFFNRGKRISKMIMAKLPELEVMPLPAVPENVNYLGLLGDWKTNISLSTKTLKEGEPLTVKIKLHGKGSLDTLKTPDLSIPGFTAYPPEVSKNAQSSISPVRNNEATIEYVLIPTEKGQKNINISFATFNTKTGEYNISKIDTTIEVTENKFSTNSTVYSRTNDIASKLRSINNGNNKINNAILYLDKNISSNVKIPLYKNHLIIILLFFILGPVLWFLFMIYHVRNNKINKDNRTKRKHIAKRNHGIIIRKIKKASPENITEVMNNSVIPFINDIKGFAPGTTVEEITKNISDKELIECLEEINLSRYMPNKNMTNDQLKNNLYKCIKRMSFVLVIGLIFILPYTTKGATNTDLNKMITLYNNGQFKQAEKICKDNINPDEPNSIWLYNLANCYFQSENLPKALVYYERALLLAPRNSDILENLNYVRSKLYLPEMYTTSTPKTFLIYMRDLFRPDEWLLILSVCVFFIFIGLISKYYIPKKFYITLISICFLIGIISTISFINQKYTIYNNKYAIVLFRDIDVYSLPSNNSVKSELNLIPGEQVTIEENMDSWIRVRTKKSEGWIKADNVERIWPYE